MGSLSSANRRLHAVASSDAISSASMSAAVMSISVTGSAATTTQRVGVGGGGDRASTCSRNSSALAKNSGASQRNRTSPSTWRASG